MTTQQAGEVLGVTPGRIRQYIKDGTLDPEKAGQVNLIPDEQVYALRDELLARDPSRPGPKPRVLKKPPAQEPPTDADR